MKSRILLSLFAACMISSFSFAQVKTSPQPASTVNDMQKPAQGGMNEGKEKFVYFVLNSSSLPGAPDKVKFSMPSDPGTLKKMASADPKGQADLSNLFQLIQGTGTTAEILNSVGDMGFELITITSFYDENLKLLNYAYYFKKKIIIPE